MKRAWKKTMTSNAGVTRKTSNKLCDAGRHATYKCWPCQSVLVSGSRSLMLGLNKVYSVSVPGRCASHTEYGSHTQAPAWGPTYTRLQRSRPLRPQAEGGLRQVPTLHCKLGAMYAFAYLTRPKPWHRLPLPHHGSPCPGGRGWIRAQCFMSVRCSVKNYMDGWLLHV